jgi:methyltransferase family protein
VGLPIDSLTDIQLEAINKRYGWLTGTRDSKGRVLGNPGVVFDIPERRVEIAHKAVCLTGKTVVEFGSLEGGHTVALCRLAGKVVCLEGRDKNIEKTRERCRLYGVTPEIVKADLEYDIPPKADVFFHSGVLYHLQDPVGHLIKLRDLTDAIVLDTHHVKDPTVKYECPIDGKLYDCWLYNEPSSNPKAGLRPFSRWLALKDIVGLLSQWFSKVEVARDEKERNGPRATIVAFGKK